MGKPDQGAAAAEGARRATGDAAGNGRGGRFSARRKRETVLRLLRGEDLESVSRELGITAARASQWRDQFLAAGQPQAETRCARPKVLGCETRWDKVGRMRDTPCVCWGFFVAAGGRRGSRLLVDVSPHSAIFEGGWTVLTPWKIVFEGPLGDRLGLSYGFNVGTSSAQSCRPAAWPASGRSTPAAGSRRSGRR